MDKIISKTFLDFKQARIAPKPLYTAAAFFDGRLAASIKFLAALQQKIIETLPE